MLWCLLFLRWALLHTICCGKECVDAIDEVEVLVLYRASQTHTSISLIWLLAFCQSSLVEGRMMLAMVWWEQADSVGDTEIVGVVAGEISGTGCRCKLLHVYSWSLWGAPKTERLVSSVISTDLQLVLLFRCVSSLKKLLWHLGIVVFRLPSSVSSQVFSLTNT